MKCGNRDLFDCKEAKAANRSDRLFKLKLEERRKQTAAEYDASIRRMRDRA